MNENIKLSVNDISLPASKQTLGYPLKSDMDAVDLFIGSEGTLGVITEVELKLITKPHNILSQIIYFHDRKLICLFVNRLCSNEFIKTSAIEYFDSNALELLRERRKEEGVSSCIAKIYDRAKGALYVEIEFRTDEELEIIYEELEQLNAEFGIDDEMSWAGFDNETFESMRVFRHAVPETINSIIRRRKTKIPQLRKFSTDMSVPFKNLCDVFSFYEKKLDNAACDYVVFGHIGEAHLHVNLLPRSIDELNEAEKIIDEFADYIVSLSGSVSAEHGIGRLKKRYLTKQFSEDEIDTMRSVKNTLDPKGLLNRGVLFD